MNQITKLEPRQEAEGNGALVSMIERIASNPDLPVERLEKMLDMQERILEKQEKSEHAAAVASAMSEMPAIPMNGVGHNRRPYATLKDITSATRPVLAKHGLSLTFDVKVEQNLINVTARLTHRNGFEKCVSIPLPADTSGSKSAVQSIGSSQTYGQRYTAQAILGLSLGDDADDDGKAMAKDTISEEEYREVRGLIEKAGVDEKVVFEAYGVTDLTSLPKSALPSVQRKLNKTIEARK